MHTVKAVADAYFNHLNILELLVHLRSSTLWAALQVFSVFNGSHCFGPFFWVVSICLSM